MIEIFPFSLTGFITAFSVKIYFLIKKINYKVKISLYYHPYKSHFPTTYFIIKSRGLTYENMHAYLKDIRERSQQARIIIIGSDINYHELFQKHYRVFGVIDTSENKSWKYLKEQVFFYLDGIYSRMN